MIRWDGPEREEPEPEWIETSDGHLVRRPGFEHPPPEPEGMEAHRRTRFYDGETGSILREDHDAVRVRFRRLPAIRGSLGAVREPPVWVSILIGGAIHGATWWLIMCVAAFGPSPLWMLVPVALVPVLFGWRFFLIHIVLVWTIGSLFLAFDGYYGMVVSWILAGLFAPGRWLGGDW